MQTAQRYWTPQRDGSPSSRGTTSVWCATSPDLKGKGGLYAQDCDIAPLLDHTDPGVMAARFPLRWASWTMRWTGAPGRLWTLSEELLEPEAWKRPATSMNRWQFA